MTVSSALVSTALTASPSDAWAAIIAQCADVMSEPLVVASAGADLIRRETSIAQLDSVLATAAWPLWQHFAACVPHTAARLREIWQQSNDGLAILLLDGLSLRELPWVIQEGQRRGFQVTPSVTAAELPADSSRFAQAIGLSQRSDLSNDNGRRVPAFASRFPDARTESTGMSWSDLARFVAAERRLFLWHHFPDERLHDLAADGAGLHELTEAIAAQFASDAFWSLIGRLCTGRTLVIASDHGYAATHLFPDATDASTKALRTLFGAKRFVPGDSAQDFWVPPLALPLDTGHGVFTIALGRRKWKVPNGHPTLSHGGLTLLEALCPFVLLSKKV